MSSQYPQRPCDTLKSKLREPMLATGLIDESCFTENWVANKWARWVKRWWATPSWGLVKNALINVEITDTERSFLYQRIGKQYVSDLWPEPEPFKPYAAVATIWKYDGGGQDGCFLHRAIHKEGDEADKVWGTRLENPDEAHRILHDLGYGECDCGEKVRILKKRIRDAILIKTQAKQFLFWSIGDIFSTPASSPPKDEPKPIEIKTVKEGYIEAFGVRIQPVKAPFAPSPTRAELMGLLREVIDELERRCCRLSDEVWYNAWAKALADKAAALLKGAK